MSTSQTTSPQKLILFTCIGIIACTDRETSILKLNVWPPSGDHALQSLEGYFAKYFRSNVIIFLSV